MTSSDFVNRPFGDYHIYRHLGGGAMADVFLAEQRSLGRRVALKILKRDLATDEMNVRRFTHEARAVARMTHPNIVHVYEVGQWEGLHFIAQEYVPGSNLLQLIEKHGALGVDQVVHILRSTAAALEKASREGIVHRDIKPENILISETGEVKVADFGLARVLDMDVDAAASPALTQAGMTVGTPLYMSPEQAQGRPLDMRSDMYSLGITCYHALAGHPPFQGETSLSVALAHVNTPPKPLEQIRQDIPPALARIVHWMIAKKPEQRYPSFLELRQDLQVLQSQYPAEFSAGSEDSVWSGSAFESGRNSLAEATTRLGGLMRQESRSRFRLGRFTLFFLATFLVTAAATVLWSRLQPPILSAQEPLTIPRKHNVAEQWIYACRQRSDDPQRLQTAWWAVAQYFPEAHPIWEIKAKRQIARIDYQYHNPVGAIPIFQEFADMSDAWPEYRTFGLAGLAWCYANAGKYDTAISLLHECLFVGSELESFDSLTRQLFEATLRLLPEAPPAIRNVPEEMSDGENEPEPVVAPSSGTSPSPDSSVDPAPSTPAPSTPAPSTPIPSIPEDAARTGPASERPQSEAGSRKPAHRRGAGQPAQV